MRPTIERYLCDIIKGKKKGIAPYFIKWALLPLSWLYRLMMTFRNWLYDKGWMRRYISPVPLVISIGNIVAGGTGKTPITLLLAEIFYNRFSLAILSRGYRSESEKLESPVVLCDGNGPLFSASYCGDEPYFFAQRLPGALVIVGGDRQKASCIAAKAGAQIILLDDGMQHRRLARDFDLVVLDVGDPFGQNHFLPRGFLREDKKSLSRADLVILNRITGPEQFEAVKKRISPYCSAPVVGTNWQVESVNDLSGNQIPSLKGLKVGMFCGIASPDCFRQTLEQEGAIIVNEYCVSDHQSINEKKFRVFARFCAAKGAQWLVCTEKDKVKLDHRMNLTLPIAWLKMEMNILEGKEEWLAFLEKAEAKIY
jgi:tetraacyldisaccharide 4'-kinase